MARPSIFALGMAVAAAPIIAYGLASDGNQLAPATGVQGYAPPSGLPRPTLSGKIPLSVDVPKTVQSPEQARPWFDEFSWQSFIALNWPADPARRGEPLKPGDPSVFLEPPTGSSTVWETYKEAYELFGQKDRTPTPWDSRVVPLPACEGLDPGVKVMMMVNKGGTLLDGVNEAFSFPVIDQFNNYAWTEIRFDKAQYEFIRDRKLYLVKNLFAAQPVSMPASKPPDSVGSIMLKATWRRMTPRDDKTRYHVVESFLVERARQVREGRDGTRRPPHRAEARAVPRMDLVEL